MRIETDRLVIGNMKYVIQLITGLFFLVQVVIAYLPSVLENGLYEFELTFLSNAMMGMIFIIGGLMGLIKKRDLPQVIYMNCVVILQIVFLICMAFFKEFNFSGPFIFLHIVDPIIATIEVFLFCESREKPTVITILSSLIFPMVYLTYAILYGYVSGHWIYGIISIPDRGLGFVSGGVLGTALVILGLTWFQYRISRKRHQE